MKIHNFKAFRTKYGYSRLQENDVKGIRGQEEISINFKPFRFGGPESKSRTESNGCFYPFINLVANGLQYAKDGFQLFKLFNGLGKDRNWNLNEARTPFFFIYTISVRP